MLKVLKKYEKKTKVKKTNTKWIIIIFILAFFISLLLSLLSELIIPNSYLFVNIFLVLFFILLGIVFDTIGLAVVSSNERVFNSMASNKVNGAKIAIKLIKDKDKVSSFCNDVIGDICGVISGSCGITIALKIANIININQILVTVILTSFISALTIGGKAIGKVFAVNNSDDILYGVAKIISFFKKDK